MARNCHWLGRKKSTLKTYVAPSNAPGNDPRPPMTTIVNTSRLRWGR